MDFTQENFTIETTEGNFKQQLTLHHHKRKLQSSTRRLNNSSLCVHAVPAARNSPIYVSITCENKFICYNIRDSTKHPLSTLAISGGTPVNHKINPHIGLNEKLEMSRLEYVVGFQSGSILYANLINKKNIIMNKKGRLEGSGANSVHWINANVFVTAHGNGRLVMFNKNFSDGVSEVKEMENKLKELKKSKRPKKGDEGLVIVENETSLTNPLLIIDVCDTGINEIAVSPTKEYFVVACDDGYIRVVRFVSEKIEKEEKENIWQFSEMVAKFQSFFSGVNCCSWSGDGKFIVAGGDDDLISVFDFDEKKLVARGGAHKSFVRRVRFDNFVHTKDKNKYRIVSVGDDCCMFFWDLIVDEDDVDVKLNEIKKEEKVGKDTKEEKKRKEENIIVVNSKALEDEPYFEPCGSFLDHGTPIRGLDIFEHGVVTLGNKYLIKFFLRPGIESKNFLLKINISGEEDSTSSEEEEEEERRRRNEKPSSMKKRSQDDFPKQNKSIFSKLKEWVSFV